MQHSFPPLMQSRLAIPAMRGGGYRNITYALAALIDNAIDAGASSIEVMCEDLSDGPGPASIAEIAVLDNGTGMTAVQLQAALQFGNGELDIAGLGPVRYGMGLPSSTFSQARRVDIWTWKPGLQSPLHCYLDLTQIESGQLSEIPAVQCAAVPEKWQNVRKSFGKTGTLVVWSALDRCLWRSAEGVIRTSEPLLGRIYRRGLDAGRFYIRLAAFRSAPVPMLFIDERVRPNDPMYLMADTSCPVPWSNTPMFEPYGEPFEVLVKHRGQDSRIIIRFSVAKMEARTGHNPGSAPHGRHAQSNIGVSLLRDGREVELQTVWTTTYNPIERWWGAEIELPSILDSAFGISSDKSCAFNLLEFAAISDEVLAVRGGYESADAMTADWRRYDDLRIVLLTVKRHLLANIRAIRGALERSNAFATQPKSHERTPKPVAKSSLPGNESPNPAVNSTASINQWPVFLAEGGRETAPASGTAKRASEVELQFSFDVEDLDIDGFFEIQANSRKPLILLNSKHAAFAYLRDLVSGQSDSNRGEGEPVLPPVPRAQNGLMLLLEAWSRLETAARSGEHRAMLRMLRLDWGRVATETYALPALGDTEPVAVDPVLAPKPSVVRRRPTAPPSTCGTHAAIPPTSELVRTVPSPAPTKATLLEVPKAAQLSRVVDQGTRYDFHFGEIDSHAPFETRVAGARASIILNIDHVAFHTLVLDTQPQMAASQSAVGRIRPGVRELLLAWSRMELAATDKLQSDRIRRVREDLGDALADLVRHYGGAA